MISGLPTNAFSGPVLEFESGRCGRKGRFTIAPNLMWK
jgi:hypothetical protein